MLIDAEILKIKEWADEGYAECQLLMFWMCAKGDKVNEDREAALKYLIAFLQNKPSKAIEAIRQVGEVEPDIFEDKNEQDFFHYVYYITVAGIFLRDKLPNESALWFKKAIDLGEEFLCFKDEETKTKFRLKISAYQYWPEMIPYFDETMFKAFNLKWEKERYSPPNVANQNS